MLLRSLLIFGLVVTLATADCIYYSINFYSRCYIDCTGVGYVDGELPGHVAAILANIEAPSCSHTTWELKFDNCRFPDNKIDSGWWPSNLTNSPRFTSLTFKSCDLTTIETGAFSDPNTFRQHLGYFSVEDNPNFITLNDGMFEGMDTQLSLNIRWMNNGVLQNIEPSTFAPISKTFYEFYLDNTGLENPNLLANIVGTCQTIELPKFSNIRVGNTPEGFGVAVLSGKYFSALRNGSSSVDLSIDLSNCGLNYFEDNKVFDEISTNLHAITLAYNNLTYIPEGVFDSILANYTGVNVLAFLYYNPWHCDCNMQYAQDIFTGDNIMTLFSAEDTLCATPPSQAGKTILEADMNTQCDSPFVPEPLDITC